MSTDTKPESKADIKPDAPPAPVVPEAERPIPPEHRRVKKLDGYTIEYKGNNDTGWMARTVHDDGTATEWGKCDHPPKDATDPAKAKPAAPAGETGKTKPGA